MIRVFNNRQPIINNIKNLEFQQRQRVRGGGSIGKLVSMQDNTHCCFGLIRESKASSLQNIKKYKHISVNALYKNKQR